MNPTSWIQLNLRFGDLDQAEDIAVTHLTPALTAAESRGLVTAWFFVRKRPCWRLRYLPANPAGARAYLHEQLDQLHRTQLLTEVTEVIYEPETRAFGGAESMTIAHRLWHLDSRHLLTHRLWHLDSRHLLTHLAATSHTPADSRRRELSILHCSAMLRAAGLDWYEQGDVWARVAAHRRPPHGLDKHVETLKARIQRLISVDTSDLIGPNSPLASTVEWLSAYTVAGRNLGHVNSSGLLNRGLRDTLTHHVIFAWNRIGLAEPAQALLATTAATVIFGPDPTTADDDQSSPTSDTAIHGGTRP